MTNEEENTARELINGAFMEAGQNAPTANSITELLELIASRLRDESEFIDALKNHSQTALVEIGVKHLGTNPANEDAQLGMVGVQVLAYANTPAPVELLNRIHNDERQALALANYAELPSGETALLLIVAHANGDLFAAVGEINYDRQVTAFALSDADIDERADSPAMADTARALIRAAERRSR
jgi:hypothetical protein